MNVIKRITCRIKLECLYLHTCQKSVGKSDYDLSVNEAKSFMKFDSEFKRLPSSNTLV